MPSQRVDPALPAAVLWDMDGTLLDSEKLWDIPLYEFAERLGFTLSAETRRAMIGSNVPTTMRLLFAEGGIDPAPEQVAEAVSWVDSRMAELFATDLVFRPGAPEALRAVRATGLPTALVTSTERPLTEIALDAIGRDLFDTTVCGDEVDRRNKPLPDPYLKAAHLLGVDPARCVAVEDSPTGATSAVAAGCLTVVVPCEVPVPAGPRRVQRDSLIGFDADTLRALAPLTRVPAEEWQDRTP
ncbi:HAD family hydrolase [Actinokineospora bangkokensis]|uniref:HAD family hydrolase n=1 Tax=Actinokineospora bangkokensis TaxID=1193682 RepID=A0A1Q9LN48_9PSEU|nr:HAD family phosphatase [Actinokineospora bangkokensis]OLR93414.1 HAD family hydrolase [Actinokineospora bangkokensis]